MAQARVVERREVTIGATRTIKLSLTEDSGGRTIWIAFFGNGKLLARSFIRPQFANDVANALRQLAREAE